MRHNVGLTHDLNTAHGSSGRHIRFCYRADKMTRWRSSCLDYWPYYGGCRPPQNLGRDSISRHPMILSEAKRTITTRSFNTRLSSQHKNCVGATLGMGRARATNIGTPLFIHGLYCSIRSLYQPPTPLSFPPTSSPRSTPPNPHIYILRKSIFVAMVRVAKCGRSLTCSIFKRSSGFQRALHSG